MDPESHGDGPERPTSSPAVDRAEEELRRQAALASEYLDLARRCKADFINYQARIGKEREEWSREAVLEFIRDFLPALDSFSWVKSQDPSLRESLRVIEQEFLRVLRKREIVPLEPSPGEAFDPELHEAVASEPSPEGREGTILGLVRRGWTIGSHIIRPAGVRVSRAATPVERDGTSP
jgi:molecular chaperone GrpE